jgi:multimeric flavodoxin WrbA
MKITVFHGSPWAEEGHTHIMAQEFSDGAAKAGAKVQSIQLVTKKSSLAIGAGFAFSEHPANAT